MAWKIVYCITLTIALIGMAIMYGFVEYQKGYWKGRRDELEGKDDPFGELRRNREKGE